MTLQTPPDQVLWDLSDLRLRGDQADRLSDLTLKIARGVTSVIGYSGAGKSSLLNLLAGMEVPTAGSLMRASAGRKSADGFALDKYWAPQNAGLWPHLSAIEHILAVSSSGIRQKSGAETEWADNWLVRFDLHHRRQASPGELSRGEQSRLSVARALAANPEILLMDEPLAHVDPVRAPQYWKVICEHLKSTDASLVFSTHEPAVAIRESQLVICLNAGKVLYTGETLKLYRDPPNEEIARFLGPINWFDPTERRRWLPPGSAEGASQDTGLGLRPEHVHLREKDGAAFRILSFRFSGSYAETELEHLSSSQKKTILHRPASTAHFEGQGVDLEVNL